MVEFRLILGSHPLAARAIQTFKIHQNLGAWPESRSYLMGSYHGSWHVFRLPELELDFNERSEGTLARASEASPQTRLGHAFQISNHGSWHVFRLPELELDFNERSEGTLARASQASPQVPFGAH